MKQAALLILLMMTMNARMGKAQQLVWSDLPPLPDSLGWAGMYAGVSNGALLCMGGANFPKGAPWAGGQKQWSDEIYRLEKGKSWQKCTEKLPVPAGYGVSISWQNQLILIGGSNSVGHSQRVSGFEWDGQKLKQTAYPDLPVPLANMAGALLGKLVLVVGGSQSPAGPALRTSYGLDLDNPQQGWFAIDPWPGPERILPVCAVYKDQFFLFSGETTGTSADGKTFRHILQDAYRLRMAKEAGHWHASWTKLAPMPRGASAAGTPLPVLNNQFLLWGGVDAVTALYRTPATHPGIIKNVLRYDPETDTWAYGGEELTRPARVTLPVVFWNHQWHYISGEIKAGIRTNTIVSVH